MKTNDVILHMVTKVVVFIILTLAIYLFLAGHNQPGGGFIAGLVLSSAFVLLFLAFDMDVQKGIPVNFLYVAATGVFLVVTTGLGSLFMKEPFLTQVFTQVDLPLIGVTDIGTMMLFEAGVALAVVGVVITIILGISEDV
ncbi:Na(+)/H(+) antiporter subunit B [Paracerasibacillus soli]|uniref:Na(+)/H(+) antiporter subunit B n=1 Tax=Paracerasibacillus soli TaxID=480284 RepID=A0ABU5CUR8_9BACI|nr:Na(+)/H(+) antiporter subunit B [Virgibacillus soli]MDY0410113.1 Na(+)/H(+) antiporter subunit B [Virgibacillus soli]